MMAENGWTLTRRVSLTSLYIICGIWRPALHVPVQFSMHALQPVTRTRDT